MRRLRDFWFGEADVAPVALFRILFGVLLFNWYWQLFPVLAAFFTDDGILTRHELALSYPDRLSLLTLSGDPWLAAVIWLVACAAAVALTLGWHTRVASLLAFALVSTFSWRDPLILDGSDFVFRVAPLWLAFTAAGSRWSLDARRDARAAQGRAWAFPIRILELQIAWIYLATGLEKLGGVDWTAGTAAYYALQLEHTFARPWAHAVATDPVLSHLISWYTLALELAFLPLAMIPVAVTRGLAAAGAAAMQIGIVLLMNVGNFPLLMLAACVLFAPPTLVDRVVHIATRATPARLASGAPSQEPPRAASAARRRVAGFLLALAAAMSFVTAVPAWAEAVRPSGDLASVLRALSLDQRWDMFSPNAARSDGWLLAPALFADGTRIDLLTGRGADDRSERYSDPLYSRWTKVYERLASGFYAGYRSSYARYLCRRASERSGPGRAPLVGVELIYVERTIQAPEKGPPLISENRLTSQQC
jgi:vitamin K-dependent gamma-carboxylase-like protein